MIDARDGRPHSARRKTPFPLVLLLWMALTTLLSASARSPPSPPLRRAFTPSISTLEILPRTRTLHTRSHHPPHPSTLKHTDSILLTADIPSLFPFPAHLLLKPTENLFHPQAKITYSDGRSEPLLPSDYRLYSGEVLHPKWAERIKWEEIADMRDHRSKTHGVVGTASILVHSPGNGHDDPVYEGVFDINGVTYHVLTQDRYQRVRTAYDVDSDTMGSMVVFRDSDMTHDEPVLSTCNHDLLPFNMDPNHPVRYGGNSSALLRRDDIAGGSVGSNNYASNIGSPSGCPSTQKLVYMGVALDCNYITTYGSEAAARTQVLNNWNKASALYKSTFNISLGIVELQVQNQSCPQTATSDAPWNVPCTQNLTLDQRLSMFSQWRGDRGNDGIGLWHLMSACPTDTEVGVAWLGTLCQTSANQQSGSYVSGTAVSTASKTEWSLVSHEIGHGFGAIHDCTSGCSLSGGCCPFTTSSCDASGQFIMNPTTASVEQTFSQCTLGNICSLIGAGTTSSSCIEDPGQRTLISLQQCGNGIVDEGEDCDPGIGANSTCCDSSTCKFTSGSVCDPSNSACCTSQCQYASANTVCRPAVNAICDFAETCTGNNATCPDDKTAPDGKSCGSDSLACAGGQCTSLSLQCEKAGASLNLTTACGQKDDKSCVVSCKDPSNANQCIVLQTSLLDGSPCGYGGHCYNQTCQSGSWEDTADAWYSQNLQISIPVTVIVGLLILIILFLLARCIWRACHRQRKPPAVAARPQMRQSRYANPVPPRDGSLANSTDAIAPSGTAPGNATPARESWAQSNSVASTLQRPASQSYSSPLVYPNNPPPPQQYQEGYAPPQTPYHAPSGQYQRYTNPSDGGFDFSNGYTGSPNPRYSGGGWAVGDRVSSGSYPHDGGSRRESGVHYNGQNWVDPEAYNGPHYGPNEAYGR